MANEDVNAVKRSQEYFRLKRTLQSPGDIFELDESSRAIYIGPDSDVGEVQITYFNPDEPLDLETAVVSVNGPFVGRVDTLLATKVSSTGQPARILVNAVDIVDNAYAPAGSLALRRFNVPTKIDLMVALQELPDIPAVRADRTLRFSQVPFDEAGSGGGDDGSTDLLIPIYGRRMATVQVIGNGINVQFYLVTLQPGSTTVPRSLGKMNIIITGPVTPVVGARVIRASDAARQGTTLNAAFVVTGHYQESDWPPNAGILELANPEPRGMADLLYLNIANSSVGTPGVTKFCDVYVKLVDRET